MSVNPDDYLPLSAVAFEVLMALTDESAHGYRILQLVEARSEGEIVLHPGTLYRTLARLLEQGLLEEVGLGAGAEDRKTEFRLTPLGRSVAQAEAHRLSRQVARARASRLLKARG